MAPRDNTISGKIGKSVEIGTAFMVTFICATLSHQRRGFRGLRFCELERIFAHAWERVAERGKQIVVGEFAAMLKAAGLSSFERAIVLRPNYALARYNLAEACAATNPKRALSEYETYVAIVEGIPEEADRIVHHDAGSDR